MAQSMIAKYMNAVVKAPQHEREYFMARTKVHQVGALVREGGTGLLVGGVLGAVHAAEGLDIKGRIPGDLLLAAGAAIGAVAMPSDSFASDLRGVAQAGLTTFGFRQGYAFVAAKKKESGSGPAGGFTPLKIGFHGEDDSDFGQDDIGEDPIVTMAKDFD